MTMTPTLDYRFAGFWWRFLAFLIDQFILVVVGGIAGFVIGVALGGSGWSEDGIGVTVTILSVIWSWLY